MSDERDDNNAPARDVEYGFRDARRRTTYEHRGSSSITPRQIMEREGYIWWIYYFFDCALDYLQSMVYLQAMNTRLRLFVRQWDEVIGENVGVAVSEAREMMKRIQRIFDELELLVACLMSLAEISYLQVEDLTVFIRRRNRFSPKRNRRIDEISRDDCYTWFGQNHTNIHLLIRHLRLPRTFTTPTGVVYTGEECFLVYLYHVIKGSHFTEMARFVFGGDPRRLSEANMLFVNHGYTTFYNKISGTSLEQWIPSELDFCRRLIYDDLMSGAIEEVTFEDGQEVDREWILHRFSFDTFRIFGFLDDFGMPTARPGASATISNGFTDDIQRAFYSGYFKRHGLKAQVVFLPIGLIGSVFISELRQNDTGVLNMSGLNNYLVEILNGFLVGGLFPCLYCDGIFPTLATIVPRFVNPSPEQTLQNIIFASQRQCIEHVFGDHRNRFKWFGMPHRLRLFNQGVLVRKECLLSFFMLNCFYCLDGTRGGYFQCIPPTLEEYLPLDEVLEPPPAVDLGDTYDYWNNNDHE